MLTVFTDIPVECASRNRSVPIRAMDCMAFEKTANCMEILTNDANIQTKSVLTSRVWTRDCAFHFVAQSQMGFVKCYNSNKLE